MNKYEVIDNTYFGFNLFDEILKAINERAEVMEDNNFKAGIASADAAVRRIREEHYNAIINMLQNEDNQ